MVEYPSQAAFSAAIGSSFVPTNQTDSALELTNVVERVSNSIQECFVLAFRGPAQMPAEQTALALDHADLGTHEIFLVPYRQDDTGTYFEAVFNRLLR